MEAAISNTEIDSSSVNYRAGSPAGSKTPDTPSRCRSPGSPIGDDACPICLGAYSDKCAAGSCLHNFCLVCLKEWAKQRPVCPLCKQPFTKILYDIKSESDYKEWKVPALYPHDIHNIDDFGSSQIIREQLYQSFGEFLDRTNRRFFRYRSTRTTASRLQNEILNDVMDTYPRLPSLPPRREQRSATESGSARRLSIYTNNMWIQPMADVTGRYRESSPALYREQPALAHRLAPWVNRELAALIPPSRIGVVLSDIMDLIEHYPINGRAFRRTLIPYLGSRTRHFVHEFYNFARSPYDMVGHDLHARYVSIHQLETDIESDDSDDVIEIDSDDGVVESEPLDLSSRVAREETIGNDGSIFISSDSDSSTHNSSITNIREESQNSNFSPSILIGDSFSHSRAERNAARSLDEPGPSGISSGGSLSVKREMALDAENSDSDDCLVVDVLKPKKERTPELINISSGSESESTNQTHWKKKISKQLEDKNVKERKKPLDRTSFSLHFIGTINCQRGEDHNYCTESTSPLNPGSNRTESDDDNLRIRRNLFNPLKRKYLLDSSDSDLNTDSAEEYKPEKRQKKMYNLNNSKRAANSQSLTLSPSHQLGKKDHRSKIKSSSRFKSKPSTSDGNSALSDTLRKCNSSSSSKNNKAYCKKLRRRRSCSSSSFDSSISSSSSSFSSSMSSSSSTSSSSSISSDSSYSPFTSSNDSDESYYLPSHRKRTKKQLTKSKDKKKRKYSETKSKEPKSSREKSKGSKKKKSKKEKKEKKDRKSTKKSAKEAGKQRRK